MIVPAPSGRDFAACAISCPKSKVMSIPASGLPNNSSFRVDRNGRCALLSRHASPSSSGVTAIGENALDGLDWKKPKPLPSSPGISPRNDTSLTIIIKRMCWPASAALTPIGTSSVITATSASKSIPQASSAIGMSSRGARNESEPPWYMSGSVQKLSGISAPRALRTSSTWLTYAEPSAH